jgi:arginyl-tRNA synthetase
MTIKQEIEKYIADAVQSLGLPQKPIVLEHPGEMIHGDYATSIALSLAKEAKTNPRALAEKIVSAIRDLKPVSIEKIEIAGPGFINFYISPSYFTAGVGTVIAEGERFGRGESLKNEVVLIDYTDPNPFKEFHIGHLMSNAIGEALSRILEWNGATLKRLCYQGDIGLHVAKTMWGIFQARAEFPKDDAPLAEKIAYLGKSYVLGSQKYEDDPKATEEIKIINKKVFDHSDAEINAFYEKGKSWSMAHFDEVYARLGTSFDYFVPESSVVAEGERIVREFLKKGIFEESDGAVVFKGEKVGLHTRVFISSQGIPTYECKDVGLVKKKSELVPNHTLSIVVTANEQNDYFKVVKAAVGFIFPELAKKMKHVGHGMMRFESGKMSSRKGNVITGESLIDDAEELVAEKITERGYDENTKKDIAEAVGIGAVKYSILKQSLGGDIIYDFNKSISFEGDSGPYLQYSYARAKSIVSKANEQGIVSRATGATDVPQTIERLLVRFPEVVELASVEFAPHRVVSYLIELAGEWNSYYAKTKIVGTDIPESPYRVSIARAVATVLHNGLSVLGIKAPEKM